ncbi:MAG: hypothetical protein IPM55_23990 [Acidobacteria bacterium]|nr:hypothetical protein [Acidobacteriota bacterium]
MRDTAAFLNIVENKQNGSLTPVGLVNFLQRNRLKIAPILKALTENGRSGSQPGYQFNCKTQESLKHRVETVKLAVNGQELTDAFLRYWLLMRWP